MKFNFARFIELLLLSLCGLSIGAGGVYWLFIAVFGLCVSFAVIDMRTTP